VSHPHIPIMFQGFKNGHYLLKPHTTN